jgi:hypothetical protein
LVKDLTTAPVNFRLNDAAGFTPLGTQLYFVASVTETGKSCGARMAARRAP